MGDHYVPGDVVLNEAIADGKFPSSRRQVWQAMWAADPDGTREVLDRMALGITPAPTGRCGQCGGTDLVDVCVLSSAGPIRTVCTTCGRTDRAGRPVVFRRWVGQPTYMVDPAWTPAPARVISHPGEATSTRPPVCTVMCGPPAPLPDPPSPRDILVSAGLAHLWAGDAA